MSKSLRTPGPWLTTPRGDSYEIRGPIADEPVAQVYTYRRTPGRAEANARLIAAAPLLLEALLDAIRARAEGADWNAIPACALIDRIAGEEVSQ